MCSTDHATEWHTQDDLENDLWLYSEISDHHDVIEEPPSIAQWKAQVGSDRSASIFDTPHNHDDVTYVYSGRGRGGVSKIFRPGLAVKDAGVVEEDDVIRKMIRGVSGLGYSNELIEKSIKLKRNNNTDEFADAAEDSSALRKSTSPQSQDYPPLNASSAVAREGKPETPPPLTVILGQRRNKNLQRNLVENLPAHFQPVKESTDVDVNSDVSDGADNDYWWRNSASSSSDNSWRSSPRGGPRAPKENQWRRDFDRGERRFDFTSEDDFPCL